MRHAIFSDLHDNFDALFAVLADAEAHHADRLYYLGDVGRELELFEELHKRQIPCVYGNWEVSGLRHLPTRWRQWVGNWQATLQLGNAILAHATPDMPSSATTTNDAAAYMAQGIPWQRLFPRLHLNEEARWTAFATLDAQECQIAFHGHTHVQLVIEWNKGEDGRQTIRSYSQPDEFQLMPTARYLIGVGSAGQPDDGPLGKYVLYDDATQSVTLCNLPR